MSRGVAHVWVDLDGEQVPGLVLNWTQDGEQWSALVTFRRPDGNFSTEWVPRERLTPVPWHPGTHTAYG